MERAASRRGPCRPAHRPVTNHAETSFCLPHSENDKRRPSVTGQARSRRTACDRERTPTGASCEVGAFVPSPRGRLGCVQLLRRSQLSQAPNRAHLLPPPNAVGPIHNREEAHRRPVRRSSRQPCIRVRDVRFAVRQRIGQFWCRLCGPGGSRRSLRVFGHGCRLCDRLRRWWTEVITCHLRRPPVASALAAVHGIRRGLQVSAAAPAHAFGRQSRRVAPLTCVVRQSNALAAAAEPL